MFNLQISHDSENVICVSYILNISITVPVKKDKTNTFHILQSKHTIDPNKKDDKKKCS